MKRFLNSFQCPSVVYETSGQQEETNRPDKHRCLPRAFTNNSTLKQWNLSQTQYSQSQLYSETIWGSLPGCPRGWWCLGCKSGCTPRVVPSSLPGNMEQKPGWSPGNVTVHSRLQITENHLTVTQTLPSWIVLPNKHSWEQRVSFVNTLWSFSSSWRVARK